MLGQAKREERELKRRVKFDRVLPEPTGQTLTCLNCRRCQVLPETSFDAPPTVIYCQKVKRRHPINLTGCDLADPRAARPKSLHKLWVSTKGNYGDLGDRSRSATDILLLYLKKYWVTATKNVLEAQTRRTTNQLRNTVKYYAIGGVALGQHRRRFSGRVEGQCFTSQQTAWLQQAYNGPVWPPVATYNCLPEKRERILAQRDYIMEQVAQKLHEAQLINLRPARWPVASVKSQLLID